MSSKGRKSWVADSIGGGSRFAPCPVCGKSVAIALVHEHLNVCLLKGVEDDRIVSGGERPRADFPENLVTEDGLAESYQASRVGIEAAGLDWECKDNAAPIGISEPAAKRRKLAERSQSEGESAGAPSTEQLQNLAPPDTRQQGVSRAVTVRDSDVVAEAASAVETLEGPGCCQSVTSLESKPGSLSATGQKQQGLGTDTGGVGPAQIGDPQGVPALSCDAHSKVQGYAPESGWWGSSEIEGKCENDKRPTPTSIAPIFTKPNKVIYLIRHGNTMSNSGAAFRPFNVQDEIANDEAEPTSSAVAARTDGSGRIFDVPLSALGLKQAAALQKTLPGLRPDVILVSPLTRALQTCREALGKLQVPIEVTARHAEHVACCGDVGRPPSVLATEFPTFDLSHLPSVWWYSPPKAPNHALSGTFLSRESMGHLRERVQRFRAYLLQRPERTIVVIGHSTFFRELLGSKRRMAHCEVAQLRL